MRFDYEQSSGIPSVVGGISKIAVSYQLSAISFVWNLAFCLAEGWKLRAESCGETPPTTTKEDPCANC